MHASKERMRHGTDGRPDRERIPARYAAGQSAIGSGHFVASQGRCENRPGTRRARQQHDSRCSTPQAMHGSGFGTGPPDQGEERVIEKAARGDRGKTPRLRDRQEVLIGVQDGICERHVRLFPGRTPPGQPLARFQNDAPSCPPAIQADFTVLQPSHPFRLRGMAVCGGQVLPDRKTGPSRVDPLPVFVPLVQSQALSLPPKCRPFGFPRSRPLGRSPCCMHSLRTAPAMSLPGEEAIPGRSARPLRDSRNRAASNPVLAAWCSTHSRYIAGAKPITSLGTKSSQKANRYPAAARNDVSKRFRCSPARTARDAGLPGPKK